MSLVLDVAGRPVPQGSKTPIVVNGRAVLVEGRDKAARARFKAWRKAIADAAREAHPSGPVANAVAVGIVFRFVRPKSATRPAPSIPPDLDKLARAVLDSLTGTIIRDDGQVVKLVAEKRYCRPGEPEGAVVVVSTIDTPPNRR